MFIVVGLGNPGPLYCDTRHNIGFMVVEELAADLGIELVKKEASYVWGGGRLNDTDVVIAEPMTFMNRSGLAVKELLERFGLRPSSLIVVYDDCDLPAGRIRIRKRGGSGGHRGVSSIIEELGTEEFTRLRMGIGRPEEGALRDYVLAPFKEEELEGVKRAIKRGAEAIKAIIVQGVDRAMNLYNS